MTDFNDLFAEIYGCKALSTIHFLAEEAIAGGAIGQDLKYLNAISEENDLDTIWIVALLAQGKVDEAVALQAEVDAFRDRKASRSPLPLY